MNEMDETLPGGRISKRATGPSRSQRRREALDVLELAGELMNAVPGLLPKLPLDESMAELVAESRRVQQPIARKRQTQYLAKHLRRLDEDELEALRAMFNQDRDQARRDSAQLHRLEALRERLLDDGDEALAELVDQYPDADRTRMRQLIRQAQMERERQAPPRASRELFKLLRSLLAESPPE